MPTNLVVLLGGLLLTGFLMQWLAWRLRIPAILPLLLAGIVLGPVTGLFNPDATLGDLLFPSVSLAVALILFEGSLTLKFSELRGIGRAVHGMLTYGGLAALVLLAAAAHWIAGVGWHVAFLFGALTCVTGPTVIAPLLRTLRPTARIGNALRWEGIVLDPVGALLALLVFEALITHQQGYSLLGFTGTVLAGALIGLATAALLAWLLYRDLLPEYLQNFATLALVLGTFVLANELAGESGLLAVTVMGIALGNMPRIRMDDIMVFKEHLSVLLVSTLFIVLAARLPWPLPDGMLLGGILVFLAAQLVVRPVSIAIATAGSTMSWRERALLAFVAPRGVVAAAVSSLFALRMTELDVAVPGAEALVPLVFILIIATVTLQSLLARPLALRLGVTAPEARGVLVFGSGPVALALARGLAALDIPVVIADDDWHGISKARMAGFETFFGNPMSHHAELHLDLTAIGTCLAVSTQRELNHLAYAHYRDTLGRHAVYRLRVQDADSTRARQQVAQRLHGRVLFDRNLTHARLREMLEGGWRVTSNTLTEQFGWTQFLAQHGEDSLLLFGVDTVGRLAVANDQRRTRPKTGWKVCALVPPAPA